MPWNGCEVTVARRREQRDTVLQTPVVRLVSSSGVIEKRPQERKAHTGHLRHPAEAQKSRTELRARVQRILLVEIRRNARQIPEPDAPELRRVDVPRASRPPHPQQRARRSGNLDVELRIALIRGKDDVEMARA